MDVSGFDGTKKMIIAFTDNKFYTMKNKLLYRMVLLLACIMLVTFILYIITHLFINPKRKIIEMSKYISVMNPHHDRKAYL